MLILLSVIGKAIVDKLRIRDDRERAATLHPVSADFRGGSVLAVMISGVASGASASLREGWTCLPAATADYQRRDTVEVHYVCCDASSWVIMGLQVEYQEKNAGHKLRNVTFVRLRGAKHLVGRDLLRK